MDFNLLIHHILLLANFNVYAFNVVLWSLIHEMRISLVFPLIMLLINRYSWKVNIMIGVLLTIIGGVLQLVFNETYQAMYKTLPYILMFIIGSLLAQNRNVLYKRYIGNRIKESCC